MGLVLCSLLFLFLFSFSACTAELSGSEDGGVTLPDGAGNEAGAGDALTTEQGAGDLRVDGPPIDPNYKTIPLQSAITAVQPMTGIVLWEDTWNSDSVKTSPGNIQLEYAYVRPDSIVNGRDSYDWSTFDAFLDRVANRGRQALVRFYYVYPGRQTAVPQYIKDLSDYDETEGTSDGAQTSFPDWTHAELMRAHLAFYSAFAARYDDDARIAFLQVGFGLWGEYHIWEGPNEIGVQFPSKAFQETFLRHLETELKVLHWSISIDAADSYYSPFSSTPALLSIDLGNFDDSFMHEGHSGDNEPKWDFFGHLQRYERSPHGGELSYYSSYDQQHALDAAGMYGRTYEQLSAEFHISYMIGNDQPNYQSDARIREAGLANGYKFEIVSFRASSNHSLVEVRNIGIAPIYYDAYVTVDGVRAGESLKGLLPGAIREYGVNAGGAAPSLMIESDRLVPGQEIQFQADL